jgi:signal transduction histidine kinase
LHPRPHRTNDSPRSAKSFDQYFLAAEQLKETSGGNEDSDQLLGMISRNVNRINQLVSDLLTATKSQQLEFTSVNINDLVDEALDLARDRIEHEPYKGGKTLR